MGFAHPAVPWLSGACGLIAGFPRTRRDWCASLASVWSIVPHCRRSLFLAAEQARTRSDTAPHSVDGTFVPFDAPLSSSVAHRSAQKAQTGRTLTAPHRGIALFGTVRRITPDRSCTTKLAVSARAQSPFSARGLRLGRAPRPPPARFFQPRAATAFGVAAARLGSRRT